MKLSNKVKEDKGNAIMVLGFLLVIVTLLIGGMLLDISKAFQMKSSYNDAARKATQTAIRQQNSAGYLKAEAAVEAIRVYENISRPSIIKDGYLSSCDEERDVLITVYFMGSNDNPLNPTFRRGTHSITMNSKNVNEYDTLDGLLTKAGVTTYTRNQIQSMRYTGLEMELNESTPNVILPSASKIARTDDGADLKCQILGISAGASQYLGREGQFD